jgi:glutathione S-transferase
MIKLHQFPLVWGRNISPFCLKLETWLKLAKLPYTVVAGINPRRGPKGKLPFIEDEDGTVVGDSSLAIEYLKRTRGIDPDHTLSREQRAAALALQRLIEDHFVFVLSYSRWLDETGWATAERGMLGRFPPGLRQMVGAVLRRQVRRVLHDQGLGRHSQEEIYAMGRADLEAIAIQLGSRPYFFGDQPTTIDAVAYGCLANLLLVPIETELKRIGLEYDNLRLFCERLAAGLGDPVPHAA